MWIEYEVTNSTFGNWSQSRITKRQNTYKTQTNATYKMALINNNTKHSTNQANKERGQTEPGLVAFYVIRSWNGAGLYSYNPRARTGATKHIQLNNLLK